MPRLSPANRVAWLRLARTEGVGPVTFDQLLRRGEDAAAVLEALPTLARRAGRSLPFKIPSAADAEAE
ncbi:MAG TPA: DNA-protecting protein DprA, partial [Phenylobacterium sp.]